MSEYNQEKYINYYLRYAFKELGKPQHEVISDLKKNQPYVSALMNGRKKVGREIAKQLAETYGFDEAKIMVGDILKEYNDESNTIIKPLNPTKEDVIKQLNKIKKRGKGEGRLIDESELVPAEQYIIPIKGQAGLKKAFFAPDQYIEDHFEKEIIYVKPNERTKYHKIEVDGNSMPGILDPGDWARCEDIPRIRWDENGVFKPNKVYCLFHRYKGPLFKRITKTLFGQITLSSDNPDKTEYPDETFDLMEFSKILIVRKKEVDL